MHEPDDQWFIDAYDEAVREAGDEALKLDAAREAVADKYEQAVESGDLKRRTPSVHQEGIDAFDRVIPPQRTQRKSRLRDEMDYIIAAIDDETILGVEDPALALAYPIGDGTDKILTLWTAEDWDASTLIRQQKAREVVVAATAHQERAYVIAGAIRRRGLRVTGQLFTDGE